MKSILVLVLFSPLLAFSAPCENSKDHMSFNMCASNYHESAFKKLGKTYDLSVKKVSNSWMNDTNSADGVDAATYLKKSQNLWWQFKEFDCKNPVLDFGGTGLGAKLICEADKAIFREKELRKIYLQ